MVTSNIAQLASFKLDPTKFVDSKMIKIWRLFLKKTGKSKGLRPTLHTAYLQVLETKIVLTFSKLLTTFARFFKVAII